MTPSPADTPTMQAFLDEARAAVFDNFSLRRLMKTDGVNLETGKWDAPRLMLVTIDNTTGRIVRERPYPTGEA